MHKLNFIYCRAVIFFVLLFPGVNNAQTGTLKGNVTDATNNQPVPFAIISLQGVSLGTTADINGNYLIENIKPGLYNITASVIGYEKKTVFEVNISSTKTTVLNFELQPALINLSGVEVTVSRFEKTEESPVSKIKIRSAEIKRSPGSNRDISKVLQSFPGVASSVSFRNDIIIRGGAPNENRFYLDGIETPNINHFATQGSSGGPVGMINVNFIDAVDFYSGAFPAGKGNTLSSVLEFRQKEGNPDRIVTNITLGSSDVGLTLDGPLSKKTDMIFSVRRSYLQLLFTALKLPFLPTYNDAQFKINYKLDKNKTLTVVGLGAIDQFRLNEKANNGVTDSSVIDRNNYILGYIPTNDQWNYTLGLKYTTYTTHGYSNVILSRNVLDNSADKYNNNDDSKESNLILRYQSQEAENKFRYEYFYLQGQWRFSYGLNYEYARYNTNTYQKLFVSPDVISRIYDATIGIHKGGGFVQASDRFLEGRLILSAGLRTDFNNYSSYMSNPLKQLSPRFSASWQLSEKWYLNFNTGKYFQLPPYTVLGYKDSTNNFVNKQNGVKYIDATHIVTGIEYVPDDNTKYSLEGFYKKYSDYPYLIDKNISLANLGSDFGVIGNEPATSNSKGRSYGFEVFFQRTIKKGFYGIAAYTFVRSEFTNAGSTYVPSSWDNRHILTMTAGKEFAKNWELGLKFRYLSGAPYTPYDYPTSALKEVWDVTHQGVLDYNKINENRLPATHQLDVRIDKKFFIRKKMLDIYLDIQNIYNRKTQLPPYLTAVTDANNNYVTDPNDSSRYLLKEIPNESGTILPSVGITFEF